MDMKESSLLDTVNIHRALSLLLLNGLAHGCRLPRRPILCPPARSLLSASLLIPVLLSELLVMQALLPLDLL